jgi:hypothetical protein
VKEIEGVSMQFRKGWLRHRLPIFLGGLLFLAPPAHALVGLSVMGGAVKDHATSRLGAGGGLLVTFHRTTQRLSLETGALVLGNHYANSVSATSVYIPGTLNLHFRHFALYGGGYYDSFLKSGWTADYGWRAGIRLGSHRWFLDGSYSRGLKDFGGDHYATLMGMLGYRLGIL